MKKILSALLLAFLLFSSAKAQGWPDDYEGVMLQGFYWDSYKETSWSALDAQADELARSFDLIWLPQSGYCNTSSNLMGYTPVYYFTHNSSFGSEQQLHALIRSLRDRGTGVIADVVINHRNNMGANGSWVDYPAETYDGTTYQMKSTDICLDDDGGATKKWASSNGKSLSTNNDTGEDWPGCRDLDHKSQNVQRCVKAYLQFLLNDLGYSGFRYDMVRGFSASFVGDYNTTAKPQFSVGEHWSSSWDISKWIDGTRVDGEPQSAAFDFQFRFRVRDAINNQDWRHLGYDEKPLAWQSSYRRWAVTFVENHDLERRSNDQQDPLWHDTLAANAYLLAMPGTPCVFWRHWADCKESIKPMIEARRLAGICNTSVAEQVASATTYYAVRVKGKRANLLCVAGSKPESYRPGTSYMQILAGKGYRYYLEKTAQTVWADQPSGTYASPIDVTLTRINRTTTPPIVYTLDGSMPTAESRQLASGEALHIDTDCTLRAGLLVDGEVKGLIQREYTIRPFEAHKATIYVRVPSGWSSLNIYAWDENNKELNGSWPGRAITTRKRIEGYSWYYKAFDIKSEATRLNFVFNTSSGSRQTIDVTGVTGDRYYVVTTQGFGTKFLLEDVTYDVTIETRSASPALQPALSTDCFDLTGRRISQPILHQPYIQGGKCRVRTQ